MLSVLSSVKNIKFDIEYALEKQTFSVLSLPFSGMDKSACAICEIFVKSDCEKGNLCPFRHVKGDKSVVCKHWLRGLCKKGDECEFLHEYDMSKMPECYFYSKYAQCGNKECEFLHLDKESKIKDCPWYDRGFCRHGPNCKNRHVKKVICQNYLFGFCPEGPNCKFKHPKFELPVVDLALQQKKQLYVCDYCGEKGHKISSCFKLNPEYRQNFQAKMHNTSQNSIGDSDSINSFDKKDSTDSTTNSPGSSTTDMNNKPPMQNQMGTGQRFAGNNFNPNRFPSHHHNFQMHHHGHHQQSFHPQPPSEVTCFKCGEKGHYANKCNKSVFAFLRNNN